MVSSSASAARASEDRLPALLERIEHREQTARRRAVFYSILPVALTAVLLGYTATQVRNAQQQVQGLKNEASTYTTQIESLKKDAATYRAQAQTLEAQVGSYKDQTMQLQFQLAEVEKKLAAATDLGQYVRPINFVEAKELASRFPGSERLLIQILDLRQRGTKWKLGGQSPEEGFDSPSFAMYVLREMRAADIQMRPGESLLDASRRLFNSLPPAERPQTGDLVFYPSGYALFYFEDPREGPFVLGMTPFGITALKPDFARPVGYRHVRRN